MLLSDQEMFLVGEVSVKLPSTMRLTRPKTGEWDVVKDGVRLGGFLFEESWIRKTVDISQIRKCQESEIQLVRWIVNNAIEELSKRKGVKAA